MNSNRILFSWK